MKIKTTILILIIVIMLGATSSCTTRNGGYGVFLGIEGDEIYKLYDYDVVVIDASYFSLQDIEYLQKKGITVYSYLNVGSIESFRSYYKDYKYCMLDVYDDWPQEKWVDVADDGWQMFITEILAASLADKGIDGFFLDNLDVYYEYESEKIYDSLMLILKELNELYELPLIINGADVFVNKAIESGVKISDLIVGVNQECVFTSIDFKNNRLKRQTRETSQYYIEHLKKCQINSLAIYITEYTKSPLQKRRIESFCSKNDYISYIASSTELN